jgi:hypothetical protein
VPTVRTSTHRNSAGSPARAGADGEEVTGVYAATATALDQAQPPEGCSDPARWLDAYLIAEAHRAERGVCRCGRPLPCIAAERSAEIMAETMEAVREAEAAAAAQRAFSEAITQEIPIIQVAVPVSTPAPVGARFARGRQRDDEVQWEQPAAAQPLPVAVPQPESAPVGARFYRERRPSRHRA